ncbi:MAG TPA: AAA family ATPase [Noviherbaspirillum sp.]|uniref:AAA family ATPase n=1 Tax=Noviherbaspirillum sp. TaxID=1926288 RepID=UPI002D3A62C3|nr:AAA family ATPase [Noviherbaspirillum sp.]HYD94743.1 AAA family ATPase [Noviherbaspirillum sp.]
MNHQALSMQLTRTVMQANHANQASSTLPSSLGIHDTEAEESGIQEQNNSLFIPRSSAIVLLTKYAKKPERFIRQMCALVASDLRAARDLAQYLCRSPDPARRRSGQLLLDWCNEQECSVGTCDDDSTDTTTDDLFDLVDFDDEFEDAASSVREDAKTSTADIDANCVEADGIPSLRDADLPPPTLLAWPRPAELAQQVALFSAEEIDAYAATFEQRVKDSEERAAVAEVINHLRRSGIHRKLATPGPSWREQVDHLEAQFPNCVHYLDYLRASIVLAEREGTVLQLSPVVLDGPPGVGKSLLAQRVAELLGTSSHTIDVSAEQENSAIAGSSRFWANGHPGELFQLLVYGQYANPVIVLDEVEKASADLRFDPLAPLHALLECDSASRFRDKCHPWLKINASCVVWVCTSNDAHRLPAPIRNRLRVFSIPPLTATQAMSIALQLWQSLCAELPRAAAGVQLTEEALAVLAHHPPRSIRKALREALGRAVYADRLIIAADDIAGVLGNVRKTRLGFL